MSAETWNKHLLHVSHWVDPSLPSAAPFTPEFWQATKFNYTSSATSCTNDSDDVEDHVLWGDRFAGKNRFSALQRTFHHFPTCSPSLEVTPSVSFPETLIRLSILAKPQTALDDLLVLNPFGTLGAWHVLGLLHEPQKSPQKKKNQKKKTLIPSWSHCWSLRSLSFPWHLRGGSSVWVANTCSTSEVPIPAGPVGCRGFQARLWWIPKSPAKGQSSKCTMGWCMAITTLAMILCIVRFSKLQGSGGQVSCQIQWIECSG